MRYPRPRVVAAVVLGLVGSLLVAGCSRTPSDLTNPAVGAPSSATASSAASTPGGGGVVSASTFGAAPSMVSAHLSPWEVAEYDHSRAGTVPGATMVDLSGIGDAAFGMIQAPVASIGFYRCGSYVSIVIYADGSQDRAVALAKAADGRL